MRRAWASVALLLCLTAAESWAASPARQPAIAGQLVRAPGEGDAGFVARVFKLGQGEANILAANWNGAPTLFVDFEEGGETDSPRRPLFALVQAPGGSFRKVLVTVGETEGGSPDVSAIGFANADHDRAKELVVVLSWSELHAGGCEPIDEVRIFDDARPGATLLRQLPISKHFGTGCADTPQHFRYSTVAAVKTELKRLGY